MTRLHLPSGIAHGLDFLILGKWSAVRHWPSSNSSTIYVSASPRTTRFRSMTCCANSACLPTIVTLATLTIHSDDHHPITVGDNRSLLLKHLLNLATI